jgi:hypothetical protein
MKRNQWITPTLVRKPVGETLSGVGMNQDSRGGEIQS